MKDTLKKTLEDIYNKTEEWHQDYLVRLVEVIRPKRVRKFKTAISGFEELIGILKDEPDLRTGFNNYLTELFTRYDPVHLYIESGIVPIAGFIGEGFRKLKEHLLPQIYPDKDIRNILNAVFYKKTDFLWLNSIPDELWDELIRVMGILCHFPRQSAETRHFNHLISALQIISHKIAALGMAPEIILKIPHLDEINSPFLEQNRELTFYLSRFDDRTSVDNDDYRHIHVILDQCKDSLAILRKKKNNLGTSMRQTNIIRRLMQLIKRMKVLLLIIHQNDQAIFRQNIVVLFKELVRAENTRNSLRRHFKYNLELVNFQIVEHTASIARHYIARDRKEFGWFFLSSMGGGVIVALASLSKLAAYGSGESLFGTAMINTVIYSLCFVSIQLSGATLATKVPSVTASSIASVIDDQRHLKHEKEIVSQLKELIVRIYRSQFIFFLGNLLAAFATGYFITWILINIIRVDPGSGEKYASLIDEVHFRDSPSLFFAVIAGIFLFLSSLVTGFYENRIIYDRVPDRICSSRALGRVFSKSVLNRISGYVSRNTGKIFGNISLGLMFGFTPVIGVFFGLNLDTRHIAFATANIGISFSALGVNIPLWSIFQILFSVSIIGLLNFIVSFGLALGLAIRSRNINFRQTGQLMTLLVRHFFKRPVDYFFPPKNRQG